MASGNTAFTAFTASSSSASHPHKARESGQEQRPAFTEVRKPFTFTQPPDPAWQLGDGPNDGGACLKKQHVEIDPYEEGRPAVFNYKLLISSIVPRFTAFLSTVAKDGSSTNLAPFSYSALLCHDPPTFAVSIVSPIASAKDSLRNLVEQREAVLNVISEHFVEAANACGINAPYGVSEWGISGLHPVPSSTVRPARVQEAVFAVECDVVDTREIESRVTPGKITSTVVLLEGKRFWAREDAINADRSQIDPAVLRPISRWGGITYGITSQGIEIPRPEYNEEKEKGTLQGKIPE